MKNISVKKYAFGYDVSIYCDIDTFKEMTEKINYRVRPASSPANFHIFCGNSEINFIICNSEKTFEKR
jgi:hypothetical protein